MISSYSWVSRRDAARVAATMQGLPEQAFGEQILVTPTIYGDIPLIQGARASSGRSPKTVSAVAAIGHVEAPHRFPERSNIANDKIPGVGYQA
jgi:hypothetical protein